MFNILYLFDIRRSFASGSKITLGPLYDSSRVYHTVLYKFTDHAQCQHKMHLSESKVKYFRADILQSLSSVYISGDCAPILSSVKK